MDIVPFQYGDLEQVATLTPEGWGDLTLHFAANLQSSFCTPLKAVIAGCLAGVGNVIYNRDTAWLAQIVVHPGYRNRGLGRAITAALLQHIDPNRFPAVFLDATDMGYPVYRSLGFETIAEHVHFSGALLPAPASACIGAYQEQYLDAILQLDHEATGEWRENTLLHYLDTAKVYVDRNQVAGVFFPDLYRGLIIAKEATAGTALLQLRMSAKQDAMVPAGNAAALDFLEQNGFSEQRRSRRMRLGKVIGWRPEWIYNVTGGALG